jgi:hypothetical protein
VCHIKSVLETLCSIAHWSCEAGYTVWLHLCVCTTVAAGMMRAVSVAAAARRLYLYTRTLPPMHRHVQVVPGASNVALTAMSACTSIQAAVAVAAVAVVAAAAADVLADARTVATGVLMSSPVCLRIPAARIGARKSQSRQSSRKVSRTERALLLHNCCSQARQQQQQQQQKSSQAHRAPCVAARKEPLLLLGAALCCCSQEHTSPLLLLAGALALC